MYYLLLSLLILLITNFVGLVNLPDIPFGTIAVVLSILFIVFRFGKYSFNVFFSKNKYVTVIRLMLIFYLLHIIFTILPKDKENLFQSIKLGSVYFTYFLFLFVYSFSMNRRDLKKFENVILFFGMAYALLVIFTVITPQFIKNIFIGLHIDEYENVWGSALDRNVISGNAGLMLIQLAFIMALFRKILLKESNLFIIIFLGMGIIFQLWRALIIGTIISIIFSFNSMSSSQKNTNFPLAFLKPLFLAQEAPFLFKSF